MRASIAKVFSLILFASLGSSPLHGQTTGSAERPPAPPTELLVPAELERIVCREATADDVFEIRRRGQGWYRTQSWDGVFARTYTVHLPSSQRTITVGLDHGRRPRMLMAVWTRDEAAGGGIESVVLRFLPNGEVQDGRRTRRPGRDASNAIPVEQQRTELLPEDPILAYTLARELGYRCEHGTLDPLPLGAIWTRIGPP